MTFSIAFVNVTLREYPGAEDRFGTDADYANFVTFLQNLRSALGNDYGLSITIPSSYWYLQHFDIVNIAKEIDWVCGRSAAFFILLSLPESILILQSAVQLHVLRYLWNMG